MPVPFFSTPTMPETMINASEMTNDEAGGTLVPIQDCSIDVFKHDS